MVHSLSWYGIGIHAPVSRIGQAALNAAHNGMLAHGLAVQRLRATCSPPARSGLRLNFTPVYPADDSAETQRDLERADNFVTRWFLDPIFRAAIQKISLPQMELDLRQSTTRIWQLSVRRSTSLVSITTHALWCAATRRGCRALMAGMASPLSLALAIPIWAGKSTRRACAISWSASPGVSGTSALHYARTEPLLETTGMASSCGATRAR